MVRNSGFENGNSPTNNFCKQQNDDLSDVAYYWKYANARQTPNSCGNKHADPQLIYRNNSNCNLQFQDDKIDNPSDHPDKIYGLCAPQSSSDKFNQLSGDEFNVGDRVLKMQSTFVSCGFLCKFEANKPTVITDLRKNLKNNTDYILRIQAMPLRGPQEVCWSLGACQEQCYNYGDNILQVYFSENGRKQWFREPSNVFYDNDLCKNPNSLVNPGRCGEWQYFTLEFNIDSDCENDEVGDVSDLRFLVLQVKDGAFLIDNVELYEKCPNNSITIKGITYDEHFYDPVNFMNPQGSPYTTYSFNSVQTVSGSPVVVEDEAEVNYWSGTKVTLNPGFHAKEGSSFNARIRDCNPVSWITTPSNNGRFGSPASKDKGEVKNFNSSDENDKIAEKNNKAKKNPAISYERNRNKHSFVYRESKENRQNGKIRKSNGGITQVLVYNSKGKRISQQEFSPPRKGVDVFLKGVSSGIYLIKILGTHVNYTKKVFY
ncbi:MAG: 3-coathanger stack domain-containing protein [Flavobacteriales bacterium]